MTAKIIFFVIAGALAFIVLLQNTHVVSVKLLFWEISMSRIILFSLIVAAGFIVGFFVGRNSWDR